MSERFVPPLFGSVLGTLVEIFDLRRFDTQGALAQKTSRRYLAGERVGRDGETRALRGIADAVITAGFIPSTIRLAPSFGDVKLRELLATLKPRDLLTAFIANHAQQWDQMAGALRHHSAPIAYPRHAAGAYLRLVTIDLAVRLGAMLWLLRGTEGELPAPVWAEPRGAAGWLRSTLERAGEARPTRNDIALELGVNFKSVDAWLDGQSRPEDSNLAKLAKLLSARGVGDETGLLREMRLMFALQALFELISGIVGEGYAREMADRLIGYANVFPKFLQHSKRTKEEVDGSMKLSVVAGTFPQSPPWNEFVLRSIWRAEPDPVWRTDLQAVTKPWIHRLQRVAQVLGPTDRTKFKREVGHQPTDEELDVLMYVVQADQSEKLAQSPRHALAYEECMADPVFAAREYRSIACDASDQGRLPQAIEAARESVRLDPTNAEYHFRLGAYLWMTDQIEEALVECQVASQLEPAWDRPRVEIGVILLNTGRLAEAIQHLERTKRELLKPTPWLLFVRALAHEKGGSVGGAIAAYEELLQIAPDDGEALDRVAHLYFVSGSAKAAIDRAKKANHLGFSTVFDAWEFGYYKGRVPKERPPNKTPVELLRHVDPPWWTPTPE
ncbi:MAG: tetratricopeptide repeat protein [Polyangiaceae bacterium]